MLLILNQSNRATNINSTVDLLVRKLVLEKIQVKSYSFADAEVFIEKDNVEIFFNGISISKFSTIYFRKVGLNKNPAFVISKLAKLFGIKLIDRFYGQTNESTKLIQMALLAMKGVSVPKTYYSSCYNEKKIANAKKYLKFPIVVKKCSTSHGEGVSLAMTMSELKDVLKKNEGAEVILQEFIENKFDYRILVLGNEVAVAEKRTRMGKNEFRNNVYLGAEENFLDLKSVSEKIKDIALKAAKHLDIQVAGVDVVLGGKGQVYVFEVNSAPGFTLDEKVSNEISQLVKYLSRCERKK